MGRFNPFDAFTPAPSQAPAPEQRAAEPPPEWLTYQCVACKGRFYSGFTVQALERRLREDGKVLPDFFHADCGVETPLADAHLQFEDGRAWTPPR
jgi:hypothetical protein